MSEFLRLVGDRIRVIRKNSGMTQEELAEKSELNPSYIGGIERGTRNISLETLNSIIIALNIDPLDIFIFHETEVFDQTSNKTQLISQIKALLYDRNPEEIKQIIKVLHNILELLDTKKD